MTASTQAKLWYAQRISAMVLALCVLVMFAVDAPRTPESHEAATWHTVLEGLRFVWRRKPVLGAISLDLFAVLMGGVVALLPIYAEDILKLGPDRKSVV